MNPRSTDCKADALTTTPSYQYADNLVLISESVESQRRKKETKRKQEIESLKKTKVMVSGPKDEVLKS